MKFQLMKGDIFNGLIEGEMYVEDIINIKFTDKPLLVDTEVFDVSADGDCSVVAWKERDTLYVSTQKENQKVIANNDCACMFWECESLESLDVSNFDTSNVEDMSRMFKGCESLTKLDLANFDTSKVVSMSWMFYDCESLELFDFSSFFDTSNVENMSEMFDGCWSLKEVKGDAFKDVLKPKKKDLER